MTDEADAGDGFRTRDLAEWSEWSSRQHRPDRVLRRAKSLVSRGVDDDSPTAVLILPAEPATVLVVVDMLSPSCRPALFETVPFFDASTTAVLTHAGDEADVVPPGGNRIEYRAPSDLPDSVRAVLSLGGYLGFSAPVVEWAETKGVPFVVVQHGLLTPWAPPAPRGAHVIAWTDADARFWTSGRPDLTPWTAGSQLLWNAAHLQPVATVEDRPVVLGQLHGTELARRDAFFTYWEFCRSVSSDYRPHPNERDAVSRGLHEVLRRGGVSFETTGVPLPELARPVVSIFSTGTLEAAMRGLPAWVFHPDPPSWVRRFWERYGLSQYGSPATPAWIMPDTEPARRTAEIVQSLV